jgi:hypothetical protein
MAGEISHNALKISVISLGKTKCIEAGKMPSENLCLSYLNKY